MTYMLIFSPARYLKDRDYLEAVGIASRSFPEINDQISYTSKFAFACRNFVEKEITCICSFAGIVCQSLCFVNCNPRDPDREHIASPQLLNKIARKPFPFSFNSLLLKVTP